MRWRLALLLPAAVAVCAAAVSETAPRVELQFVDAAPVIAAMRRAAPSEVEGVAGSDAGWSTWIARRDAEIRARLKSGDEDSVLNHMLFGSSFTKRPRAVNDSTRLGGPERAAEIVRGRMADLAAAIRAPGSNERLLFARGVVQRSGIDPSAPDADQRITQLLRSILARVVSEVQGYAKAVESLRSMDPVDQFVRRSQLLQERGLSSDTSILPGYAIDEALGGLRNAGTIRPRSVARAGIIGPGLDFTDKAEGYDFYPPQTVQPFALVDSLRRLNLDDPRSFELTTFDISPRINEHLARARSRAEAGQQYVLQLVRDPGTGWRPPLVEYWRRFGDRIGMSAAGIKPPREAGRIDVRAVQVRPDVVLSIDPRDVNVVLQHLEGKQYDLLVATNVFVYYNSFEQALALVNIAKMLRPGGILLANNALPERLVPQMTSIGSTRVVYSDRADDADLIVWYQKM